MKSAIQKILGEELKPTHLEIIDESHMHSRATPGHPATHFKVIIVSQAFANLSRVKRQQMVFALLERLFKSGLHALAQHTYTPEEWALQPKVQSSPVCASKNKQV